MSRCPRPDAVWFRAQEAIPGRGTDAEVLRTDLLSLFNAFGRESGLLATCLQRLQSCLASPRDTTRQVPSSEWHSPSGLPQEALWLSEGAGNGAGVLHISKVLTRDMKHLGILLQGLQRLQAHPTLFNIRADTEFFGTASGMQSQ